MQLDKLPPPHLHLCLKCQASYWLYYNGDNEPDMIYTCHCGTKRNFGTYKKKERDMHQDEIKDIEKRILRSHNEILEYCNELAERVNQLRDQLMIALERLKELENR